jgi:hypothetical protein
MITGYNTDVPHKDVVLHVQTEDKGLGNPFIESLVYVGGRVLIAKRSGYADKLAEGSVEKDIVALMDRQHRTMIAAIRHGKFDEKLLEMTGDQTVASSAAQSRPSRPSPSPPPARGPLVTPSPPPPPGVLRATGSAGTAVAAAAPIPLAAAPVATPVPSASDDRSLDQVILEYLTTEAEQEQLLLVVEENQGVTQGSRAHIELQARSSKTGKGIDGTVVVVRMISTASEPRELARVPADENGRVVLDFDIPLLARGTSALILLATSSIGQAELKQLL